MHGVPGEAEPRRTANQTVDDTLGRFALRSSKWGNLFAHGIDLGHLSVWARARSVLPYGSLSMTGWLNQLVTAMVIYYTGGRLAEGHFIARRGFDMHIWRRWVFWFSLILARRNPNLLILTIAWLNGRARTGTWGAGGADGTHIGGTLRADRAGGMAAPAR